MVQLRNRGLIRVKAGSLQLALVTRTTTPLFRSRQGIYFKFDHNAVVLLAPKGNVPLGTRVFGPCPVELRAGNFLKVLSLATHIR